MMYVSIIKKEEDDLLVTIPMEILEMLDLEIGEEVEIDLDEQSRIIIKKKQ